MRDLRFVALSDDRRQVVLSAADGEKFAVALDDTLRDAVTSAGSRRPHPTRSAPEAGEPGPDAGRRAEPGPEGSPEARMPRPREIQARIRGGETAERIAEDAHVPVTLVRRFEGPVLAERAHIAEAARSATVRRPGDHPAEPLGELVTTRLAARGVAAESMGWDAWRQDDATWQVELRYLAGETEKRARWVFDPARRVVSSADDEARWLSDGHEPEERRHERAFVPRLASVPDHADDPTRSAATAREVDDGGDGEPENQREAARRARRHTERLVGATDGQAVRDGVAPGKRATLPTWDEIVFGSKRRD